MRFLDTETGQFVERDPEKRDTVYAILSHTWDTENGEQTYTELKEIQSRYGPGAPQGHGMDPEGGTSVVPHSKHDRSCPLPSSQPYTPSPLFTACHLPAVGCLTLAEVEALFRAFGEAYGLTIPNSAPASSDSSTPTRECKGKKLPQSIWDDPDLSPKIRDACAVARKNGYRYIWIDSCCIDKSSSSELSEAINSMYKWYGLADVCYAYLADVPPGEPEDHQVEDSSFRKSRWFERGWTLQELIAPINVEFFSMNWTPIGSKHALDSLIESITEISHRALLHVEPLSSFSVAQRFSWAARRQTTREEDRAYSLLGIFDINMPTLYGEGDRAFRRLQEQIMQRIPDQSLFAWGEVYLPDPSQLLKRLNQIPIHNSFTPEAVEYLWDLSLPAPSPQQFWRSANIRQVGLPASLHHKIGYTSTPYGIRTQFQMIPLTPDLLSRILPSGEVELVLPYDSNQWYLAILGCEYTERVGYLQGRVCYIPPSQSGVDLVYGGYIRFSPTEPELFSVSPDIIEDFRPHLELKTVYLPHPDPANQLLSLRGKSYNAIKLVLLTKTRDALCSRGYRADLRGPDPDHPTTHWLTLSNNTHTITVKFQHTLEENGLALTINAEVKMSGSRVQPDSVLGSDPADCHTVSWSDHLYGRWVETRLGPETVRLSVEGVETLTVDLGLDFVGMGFYYVCVDVRSDASPALVDIDFALPASPVVDLVGRKAREVEVTGDDSPSTGVVCTEDSEAGQEVEAGRRVMASVQGVQDLEVSGNETEGEDRGGSG